VGLRPGSLARETEPPGWRDDEVLREAYEHVEAFIMGRRIFDEGEIGSVDGELRWRGHPCGERHG
jgi:hypothetical protein